MTEKKTIEKNVCNSDRPLMRFKGILFANTFVITFTIFIEYDLHAYPSGNHFLLSYEFRILNKVIDVCIVTKGN